MPPQLLLFCRTIESAKPYFSNIPQTEFAVHMVQDEGFLNQMLDKQHFSLLILDCSGSDTDYFELIRRSRRKTIIPILVISNEPCSDRRAGYFETGADDVVNLSVGRREFIARIKAKIDNKKRPITGLALTRVLDINGVKLDPNTREVLCNEKALKLTSKEFNVLHTLMRHPGIVVNKKQLYKQALNTEPTPLTRGVDTHICNIRRKLKSASERELLHTVRGVGYIFLTRPPVPVQQGLSAASKFSYG